MKQRLLAVALSIGLIGATIPARARANDELGAGNKIKRVLLISVDGLHALDVSNYVAAHPGSALAELASHGITYSNARTPANSDSFPGLLALVRELQSRHFRPHEHELHAPGRQHAGV